MGLEGVMGRARAAAAAAVLLPVAGLASAAAVAPAFGAHAGRSISIDVHIAANLLPQPPAVQVDGVMSGAGASGPIVLDETSSGGSTSGRWIAYDTGGSLHGTDRGSEVTSGGAATLTDTLTVSGGTGRFRGAAGTLTATGTANLTTGVTTEHLTGKVRVAAGARPPGPAVRPASHAYAAVARLEVAARHGDLETLAGPVTGFTSGGGAMLVTLPQFTPQATATVTYYDGRGTLHSTVAITRVRNPDGTVTSLSGSGVVDRGTGRYRRVRVIRHQPISGSRDPSVGLITLRFSGVLRY